MEYVVSLNVSDMLLGLNSNSEQAFIDNISSDNTNTTSRKVIDGSIPLYIYIVTSMINICIFVVGTFGNVLVIVAVTTVRDMRTPTNLFLLNLSVADILVLLICQPAGLLEFYGKDRWLLGEIMCKLVPLLENSVVHVSTLTMLAVTFERYNALCHPFKQRMVTTTSATVRIIIIIWLVGVLVTLPFVFMTELHRAKWYDGSSVHVCRTIIDSQIRHIYIVGLMVLFFIVPLFALIGFYTLIIKQLMSDKLRCIAQNERSAVCTLRSRKQVVKMLIVIIILFFLSLFPIRVLTIWLLFANTCDIAKLGTEGFLNLISWSKILMYINSVGNPIIYKLTSTKFQSAFNRILWRRRAFRSSERATTILCSKRGGRSASNAGVTQMVMLNNTNSVRFKRSFKSTSSSRSTSSKNYD